VKTPLLLVALCALTACASFHTLPDLEQALAIQSEAYAGYTTCGTKPRSWIADDLLDADSASLAGLRAHEAAHREIAAEFPSCQEYAAWLANPLNRLRTEAYAYCVQAHVETAHGKYHDVAAAFVDAGRHLLSPVYPPWPLTRETAAELVSISCGDKVTP
jgi:hypothetical protein